MDKHRGFPGRLPGTDHQFTIRRASPRGATRLQARERFRELLPHDEATWRRAAGWALLPAMAGLDYYRHTAPHLAERGRREIRTVIAELGTG